MREISDCFVVGEAYKFLTEKKMTWDDLTKYPLVFPAHGSTTRKLLDDCASKNNVKFNPDLSLAGFTLVTEFTRIGFGIGFIAEDYIKEELVTGKLYKLNVVPGIPKRNIGIAYSKINSPSFCTQKLIEIILDKNVF